MEAQDEQRSVNEFSRVSLKLQQYRRLWPHPCQSVNEIAPTRSAGGANFALPDGERSRSSRRIGFLGRFRGCQPGAGFFLKLFVLAGSHFRTENRIPLFLQML
jgi:hypothetical protein